MSTTSHSILSYVNQPKFHAISHFIQYIWDYKNAINNLTAHSKRDHKYFFKIFYNKTNKKKYDLQIWELNVCHTNTIFMKNMIISEKIKKKKSCQKLLQI